MTGRSWLDYPGLAEVPTVSSDIVERLNARSIDELRSEAAAIDADAAGKIESGDRQRLIRLISVFRETGQTLSSFQKDTRPLLHPDRLMGVVIQPDRDVLYRRIEQRFDAMLSEGALDEARAIHRAGLDRELPALKAVGLRPLLGHLDGDIDLETAIDLAKRDSRRYAKRQFTWFANQHPHWARIDASDLKHQIDQLDKLLVHF